MANAETRRAEMEADADATVAAFARRGYAKLPSDPKRLHLKLRALLYLGGKCAHCGSNDLWGLEFDHIDPATKSFTVASGLARKWENLQKELDKCQLLCHPCHVEKSRKDAKGIWERKSCATVPSPVPLCHPDGNGSRGNGIVAQNSSPSPPI